MSDLNNINSQASNVETQQYNTELSSDVAQGAATKEDVKAAGMPKPRFWYADSSTMGSGAKMELYTAISSAPSLPHPEENVDAQAYTTTLTKPTASLASEPLSGDTNVVPQSLPLGDTGQNQAFSAAFTQALAAYQPPLSPEDANLIRYMQMTPGADHSNIANSADLQNVLTNVTQTVLASLVQKGVITADWQPATPDADEYESTHNDAFESAAEEYVKSLNLPPDQAKAKLAQLKLAYFHPELADASTKTILDGLQSQIEAQLNSLGLTSPPGWKPDTSGFDALAEQTYDNDFSDLVDGLIDDNGNSTNPTLSAYLAKNTAGMSPDDAEAFTNATLQTIKTLHFHPEEQTAANADLAGIAASLNATASESVSVQFGVPATAQGSWPKPDTQLYDKSLVSEYQLQSETGLRDALASQTPPLTDADVANIRAYMANSSVSIPDNLKSIADSVMIDAKNSVIKAYGLPATWAPPALAGATWSGSTANLNAVTAMEDMLKAAKAQVDDLPQGPTRILISQYLKIVNQAISKLKEQIYEIQNRSILASQDYTKAVAEASNNKVKKQEKAMADQKAKQAELDKKQEKAGKLSLIFKIVTPFVILAGVIATVASFGTLGPVAIAVCVVAMTAMTLDSAGVTVGGKSLSQAFFQDGMAKVFTAMGMSQQDAEIVGAVVAIVGAIALMAASGGAGASGGMTAILGVMTQIVSSSNVVQNITLAAGGSEQDAMIAGMVVMAVLILVSIASTVKGAGAMNQAAAEAKIAENAAQTTVVQAAKAAAIEAGQSTAKLTMKEATLKVQKYFLELAVKVMKDPKALENVTRFMELNVAGLTAINTENDWAISGIQRDLVGINTGMESDKVKMEDLIANLQGQIKKLQALIQQIAGMLSGASSVLIKSNQAMLNYPS